MVVRVTEREHRYSYPPGSAARDGFTVRVTSRAGQDRRIHDVRLPYLASSASAAGSRCSRVSAASKYAEPLVFHNEIGVLRRQNPKPRPD